VELRPTFRLLRQSLAAPRLGVGFAEPPFHDKLFNTISSSDGKSKSRLKSSSTVSLVVFQQVLHH
jgi:hypothetical protein